MLRIFLVSVVYPVDCDLLVCRQSPGWGEVGKPLWNLEYDISAGTLGIVQIRGWKLVGQEDVHSTHVVVRPTDNDVHVTERVCGKVWIANVLDGEVNH